MTDDRDKYPLLNQIDSPADLRALDEKQLLPLSKELREFVIESIAACSGHFGANLGTIELTIALHYEFNTPHDRIVWDVGHQAYPHKILTGRREKIRTIRKTGGVSPFPKRSESEYDTFGVGHSSTSISAALGMAIASKLNNEQRRCVAVIGDGAMTAGMAFEALNNGGDMGADLLVILNDNDMSISPNVGALSKYLTRLLSGKLYTSVREGGKKMLDSVPGPMRELARRAEEHVKGMVTPGTLFEELGFQYFGPVDGHDLPGLLHILRNLKDQKGPRLLHIVTTKGKGYAPAEEDQVKYHAVSVFDPDQGMHGGKSGSKQNYTQVFGQWLCDMAEQDPRLIGITPAMREGSGMVAFAEKYPDRYIDVGIAEQHSVTLAAGLACEGAKPVVAIYSTFLQRAYDQLVHDVALQNLPVLFAIDRAGLVGADGPTHAGSFDISYMRCLPNIIIMAPSSADECRKMLTTGFRYNGPAAVRYPRDIASETNYESTLETLPLGKARLVREAGKLALLSFGCMLERCLPIAEQLDATLVDMRFIKPLDEELLLKLVATHDQFVTLEENSVAGGAGSAVNELLAAHNFQFPVLNIGLPDRFIDHGSRDDVLAHAGLSVEGILRQIHQWLATITPAAKKTRQIS
ncbi:MAG: 1-deoxy-D-xylulose-5-phosphate synthase [Gammaproteobacteria bacterium]|nr:1-deoxy-D-xylulose-5-phosphate synthase [Gammaproteobacteria bacterium]